MTRSSSNRCPRAYTMSNLTWCPYIHASNRGDATLTMGQILHTRGLCWTERIREWSCIRGGAQCTFRCSRHTRTAKLWKTWTELAPCPKTSEDSKVGCNFPRTSQEHNSQQIQYPIRRRDRNCAAQRVLGRAIKTTRFGLCA